MAFGFAFLIASFVIFLIKERTNDSKHLQYLSGADSNIFYLSSFIWDMFNYIIPCFFVVFLLWLFDISAYVTDGRWLISLLILILYGMAIIPQMYLFSYIFKVSSTGFATLVSYNIMTSQVTLLPVAVLSIPMLGLMDLARYFESIFIILFPNFSIGQAFVDIYNNDAIRSQCKVFEDLCDVNIKNPCCYNINPKICGPRGVDDCFKFTNNYLSWEKPGLGRFVALLPSQFVLMMTLVLIIESGYARKLLYRLRNLAATSRKDVEHGHDSIFNDIPKDIDVINEENRISSSNINKNNNEIFIVDQLTKYYGNFMAVKGISFTLNKSQCFGLLGINFKFRILSDNCIHFIN